MRRFARKMGVRMRKITITNSSLVYAGTDNEIDGDLIKLYDELVKSPEDRLALEKKSRR
jgi:hypothetical protein